MISAFGQIQNKNRTRILFVIESLTGGGAEKVLTTLIKLIDKEKFYISVCTVVDTGVYTEEVKKYADAYTSILGDPVRMGFLRKLWYKIMYKLVYHVLPMRWICTLFVPLYADVEVAFTEGFVTKLMAASTNLTAKKIAWVHTDLENNHWTSYLYKNDQQETEIYRKYCRVICVSKSVERSFLRILPACTHVFTCYNPIDAKTLLDIAHKDSILPNKTEKRFRIISCGRLVYQKGFDRLIRAINIACIDKERVEVYIYGLGPEEALLTKLIYENRLQNTIHLCGFRQDFYRDLKTADLFICSSRVEGFSLVIAEALILGVPVLSTYCSGPNELLEEGKYGYLCDNSTEGLSSAISELCGNKELLTYYKNKAMERGAYLRSLLSVANVEKLLDA